MIQDVELDTSPMSPSEVRRMTVRSTGPLDVLIECFVGSPPPPGLRPCPECGSLRAQSGQPIDIIANSRIFRSSSGSMEINITDTSDGDVHHISISASNEIEEEG